MTNWQCPICAKRPMPYGTLTCNGKPECGHEAHATGQAYVDKQGRVKKPGTPKKRGVGISEISNEDN